MGRTTIAIMAGGNSSEAGISIRSAGQIAGWLNREKYEVYTVSVRGVDWDVVLPHGQTARVSWDTFSAEVNGTRIGFQCAVIAIHGTPGENGLLQAYFEMKGIPYTTCNVLGSAITFDKEISKRLLHGLDVGTARDVVVRRGQPIDSARIAKHLGLPLFVKPNDSGSSYGISKVKRAEEIGPALDQAFAESDRAIIEEYIPGGELTCGLVKTRGKALVFPVTEVVPMNEYFDYSAKYLNQSQEITPARISPELTERVQSLSSEIYDRLRCRGIVRIDYINSNGKLYFLEVNTVPGMSEASIVPQQVAAMGLTMGQVLDLVIGDAMGASPEHPIP